MQMQTMTNRIKVSTSPVLQQILERYILVGWPEIQIFMEPPRWSDFILCTEIAGHPCPDNSYMVPESLYKEVNNGVVN